MTSPRQNIMEEYGKAKFKRYEGKEEGLQEACIKWTKLQHPKLFVVHIPNEGKHKPHYRTKMKRMGLVSGMPDILIFDRSALYAGLAIELKAGYNTPKDTQKNCLNALEEIGWYATWVRSLDAYQEVVTRYVHDTL